MVGDEGRHHRLPSRGRRHVAPIHSSERGTKQDRGDCDTSVSCVLTYRRDRVWSDGGDACACADSAVAPLGRCSGRPTQESQGRSVHDTRQGEYMG